MGFKNCYYCKKNFFDGFLSTLLVSFPQKKKKHKIERATCWPKKTKTPKVIKMKVERKRE
jgi:hypothetical protein